MHSKSPQNKSQTSFADDPQDNASKEDHDDATEDTARDGKKHPPLQNYRLNI